MKTRSQLTAVIGVSVLTLTLTSCAQSKQSDQPAESGDSLTFGATASPKVFDPFYANDGETFRVTGQIFEGLVGYKPGTSEIAPGLAKSWTHSPDGRTWDFTLQEGVKFQDGTDFNADAVCKNFERMYSQTGAGASPAVAQYWVQNLGGFKDGKSPSLYKGCEAVDTDHATLHLTHSTSKIPTILGLPSFVMQSPTAMDKYNANDVKTQGTGFIFPEYATAHPVGTGPFKFEKYDEANKVVTVTRNDDYWDSAHKAKLAKLIFKTIPDESTRRQELEAGSIDGYDLPNPIDWKGLRDQGFNVYVSSPDNFLYLGFNPKTQPKLKNLKVRQALAYAINRDQLVKTQMPEKSTIAAQFMPDTAVPGLADEPTRYSYDPAKAKSLLAEANASGMSIELWYPSEVSRPYMPDPQRIFNAVRTDFEAVGIDVKPVTKPWNGGYVEEVDAGKASTFFLGWSGGITIPDNWIGSFFSLTNNRFGTGSYPWGQELAQAVIDADSIPDESKRQATYKKISDKIMTEYLPGVPLAFASSALVVSPKVHGMLNSPMVDLFNAVSIQK